MAKTNDKKDSKGKGSSSKGKVGKGKDAITGSDVKEATDANAALNFPDAPAGSEKAPQEVAAKAPEVAPNDETPFPADAPVAPSVEAEVPVVEVPVAESPAPVTTPAPAPATPEEQYFEKWWNGRNRPAHINDFELKNDINTSTFDPYKGDIGKFKFRRSYVNESWKITVEEK